MTDPKRKDSERDNAPREAPESRSMRLNKYVAHCGVASRRKASELIKNGMVTVNGEVITNAGHRVSPEDKVHCRGKEITLEEEKVYILLNKPKNTITTLKDEKGRKTVMDLMDPKIRVRIFPVGRLDRNTTGLLLLTNDGQLAKKLAHPSHQVKKIYHVILDKPLSQQNYLQIANGITLEDGPVHVDAINYIDGEPRNALMVEIHLGRNRIVRRIFEHFGHTVKKLDRVYFAGLTKKDLPRGKSRMLTQREIIMLRHFT